MKDKTIQSSFLLIISFLLISFISNAQINRDHLISTYIYKFANNITIPNNTLATYKIILISDNKKLESKLQDVISKNKIQGVNASVVRINQPDSILKNAQLIYISSNKLDYYMRVFDMVEKQQTLIVSDGFENESYVMIDIFDDKDGSVKFKLNRLNIKKQDLLLSDEVLLMGGTKIDIAEIYLKSKHTLRKLEKKLESSSLLLDSLQQVISNAKQNIEKQSKLIESHEKTLKTQDINLSEYAMKIKAYDLQQQKAKISLKKMHDSLSLNREKLRMENLEIQKSNEFLQKQKLEIDSINNEIALRNQILTEKETVIDRQNSRLRTLITILLVILILVVLLVSLFIKNKKKSMAIQEQSTKIKNINEELNANNDKLLSTLEQNRSMQEQLVHSEKMASLGILSAGIAHEINNPINFVYAGINSLLRDFKDIEPVLKEIEKLSPDDNDLSEKIKIINKIKEENYFDEAFEAIPEIISDIQLGADRTSEIVKGLRSFSRTDKDKVKGVLIHEGLDTSLLLLRNRYKNTIEVIKQYDDTIPSIEGYPSKLNQVFLNVLSNAIDAIEENGQIKISTKNNENDVAVIIQDNGAGMSEETKNKIFDPFYTTKIVGEGTGLGLSISYGIIADHKGSIKVNSEPGKGTEFIIILPKTMNHE